MKHLNYQRSVDMRCEREIHCEFLVYCRYVFPVTINELKSTIEIVLLSILSIASDHHQYYQVFTLQAGRWWAVERREPDCARVLYPP